MNTKLLVGAVFAVFAASTATASPITVLNPSFESPAIASTPALNYTVQHWGIFTNNTSGGPSFAGSLNPQGPMDLCHRRWWLVKPSGSVCLESGACFRRRVRCGGHCAVSYTHLTLPTNREV